MTQQQKDLFSHRSFKRLRDGEILDILGRAINITETICWQSIHELRSRYPGTKAWGAFIQKQKENPDSPFWSISESTLKRSVRCGKLAAQLKISDFSSLKILPSAFDLLTPIKDEKTVERIFHRIKDKNMPIKDVEKIINELVVATIPEESKQIDFTNQHYDHLFAPRLMIDVIGGDHHEPEQAEEKEVFELPAVILADQVADVGNVPDEIVIDDDEEEVIELPSITRKLTDSERLVSLKSLCKTWNCSPMETMYTLTVYRGELSEKLYPKRA